MNQKTVDKIIAELTKLKNDGKAVIDPSVQSLILNAKSSFGLHSDEFAVIVKAAGRIFHTDAND